MNLEMSQDVQFFKNSGSVFLNKIYCLDHNTSNLFTVTQSFKMTVSDGIPTRNKFTSTPQKEYVRFS